MLNNEKMGRRKFVGAVLLAAIAIPATLAAEGAKIGTQLLSGGKEGALGTCSYGSSCGGGGGRCSYGSSCSGS